MVKQTIELNSGEYVKHENMDAQGQPSIKKEKVVHESKGRRNRRRDIRNDKRTEQEREK